MPKKRAVAPDEDRSDEDTYDDLIENTLHVGAALVFGAILRPEVMETGEDAIAFRFLDDEEPWFAACTSPAPGAAWTWTMARGPAGYAWFEALQSDGTSTPRLLAAASTLSLVLSLDVDVPAHVLATDAGEAREDTDEDDSDEDDADLPPPRQATRAERGRLAHALWALIHTTHAGVWPPRTWIDAAATPVLAAPTWAGAIAGVHSDAPPRLTWERFRGDEIPPASVRKSEIPVARSAERWTIGMRDVSPLRSLGREPGPPQLVWIGASTDKESRAVMRSATPNPRVAVARVIALLSTLPARPAAIEFEEAAQFAVALPLLSPLGIEVTRAPTRAMSDELVAEAHARDRELYAISEGAAYPEADDLEGWECVLGAARTRLDKRLHREQPSDVERRKTYFAVRQEQIDEACADDADSALQDWSCFRPNAGGDRRSTADRYLRSGEASGAMRDVITAFRDAKLALYRVADKGEGEPEPEDRPERDDDADFLDFIDVVDAETGTALHVIPTRECPELQPGDAFAGRAFVVGDFTFFSLATPVMRAEDVAPAREYLARFGGDLTAASMNARPHLLGRLWFFFYPALEDDDASRFEE